MHEVNVELRNYFAYVIFSCYAIAQFLNILANLIFTATLHSFLTANKKDLMKAQLLEDTTIKGNELYNKTFLPTQR